METYGIIQAVVSASAGVLGVGVGVGIFKSTISQILRDITKIKKRQASLRGEDNSGEPRYMTKDTCRQVREHCNGDRARHTDFLISQINQHSAAIKGLSNFARWWMGKEGLDISEINIILKG